MFEKETENYRKDLKSKFFLSEPQLDLACQGFKDGYNKAKEELEAQIEKMKSELHHRLVSPSHSDSDCLDNIIGLDRLWQFGQEF